MPIRDGKTGTHPLELEVHGANGVSAKTETSFDVGPPPASAATDSSARRGLDDPKSGSLSFSAPLPS